MKSTTWDFLAFTQKSALAVRKEVARVASKAGTG